MIHGIGCDIVECLRIAQMIERHGEDFLRRVYTSSEILYCSSRSQATQEYAGRWAAKEAVVQALGLRGERVIQWREIEVKQEEAELQVMLTGSAQRQFAALGLSELKLAVSHCRTHATAYVIAVVDD